MMICPDRFPVIRLETSSTGLAKVNTEHVDNEYIYIDIVELNMSMNKECVRDDRVSNSN